MEYPASKDVRASIDHFVGGNVRYGGIFDLCSIDCDDEREGVSVRFAVVRRERMRIG